MTIKEAFWFDAKGSERIVGDSASNAGKLGVWCESSAGVRRKINCRKIGFGEEGKGVGGCKRV